MKIYPDLTIAVNGTPVPADDKYGIPLDIYEQTLDNIKGSGIEDFNIKVYGSREIRDQNSEKFSKRSIESYGAELRWLYNRMMENRDRKFRWDIALSSSENHVFPSENQINYWKNKANTRHLIIDLPHYPFHHWGTFNNMIEDILKKTRLDLTYR
jgi:hypothetical protein